MRSLEKGVTDEGVALRTKLQMAEARLEQLQQTKEALKQAARAQKRRADRKDDALTDALERLALKESVVTEYQVGLSPP